MFALFVLVSIGAANAQGGSKGAPVCPANALSAEPAMTCRCDVSEPFGAVWGSGPYTSDSSICVAAVHAGLLASEARPDGTHHVGTVAFSRSEGCSTYLPDTANGVTTLTYGSWDSSFFFPELGPAACTGPVAAVEACPTGMPRGVENLTCGCSAEATTVGSVWGTGTYTDDSAICRAALHAGAIGATGGLVEVMRAPGLEAYVASQSNGIDSLSYASWQGSLVFAAAVAKGK
jgi:hypothetical protein